MSVWPGLYSVLMTLQALALATVILRLLSSGLAHIYRFFFWYLVVFAAQTAAPLVLGDTSIRYLYVFMGTEGIIVCLYALVILELYSLVLKEHPGIATVAKKVIRVCLGGSILLSMVLLLAERVPSNLLEQFLTVERTMVSSILFFVFAITVFLAYFPVHLNRNTVFYSIGYAIYFSSKATILFLLNTGHPWFRVLELILLAIATGCMVFWAIFLSRNGEQVPAIAGHRWDHGEDKRLLGQLNALNASLLRARKEIPTNSH